MREATTNARAGRRDSEACRHAATTASRAALLMRDSCTGNRAAIQSLHPVHPGLQSSWGQRLALTVSTSGMGRSNRRSASGNLGSMRSIWPHPR